MVVRGYVAVILKIQEMANPSIGLSLKNDSQPNNLNYTETENQIFR